MRKTNRSAAPSPAEAVPADFEAGIEIVLPETVRTRTHFGFIRYETPDGSKILGAVAPGLDVDMVPDVLEGMARRWREAVVAKRAAASADVKATA
jgi:hypothetical protein